MQINLYSELIKTIDLTILQYNDVCHRSITKRFMFTLILIYEMFTHVRVQYLCFIFI